MALILICSMDQRRGASPLRMDSTAPVSGRVNYFGERESDAEEKELLQFAFYSL
jgi:hypothetical protein